MTLEKEFLYQLYRNKNYKKTPKFFDIRSDSSRIRIYNYEKPDPGSGSGAILPGSATINQSILFFVFPYM